MRKPSLIEIVPLLRVNFVPKIANIDFHFPLGIIQQIWESFLLPSDRVYSSICDSYPNEIK